MDLSVIDIKPDTPCCDLLDKPLWWVTTCQSLDNASAPHKHATQEQALTAFGAHFLRTLRRVSSKVATLSKHVVTAVLRESKPVRRNSFDSLNRRAMKQLLGWETRVV